MTSSAKAKAQKDFLADKDDDIPDDANQNGKINFSQRGLNANSLCSPEMQKKLYDYHNVYRKPCHENCKDHMFCNREEMKLMKAPQELYPTMPLEFVFPCNNHESIKDAKSFMYDAYLNEPFYYRNIQIKKQKFRDGLLSEKEFSDDCIQKYYTEPSVNHWKKMYGGTKYSNQQKNWLEQSHDLSMKLKEQKEARERQMRTQHKMMIRNQQQPNKSLNVANQFSSNMDQTAAGGIMGAFAGTLGGQTTTGQQSINDYQPNILQPTTNINVLSPEQRKAKKDKDLRRQIDLIMDGKDPMQYQFEDDDDHSQQNKDMKYGIPSPEKNPNAWYYYYLEPQHTQEQKKKIEVPSRSQKLNDNTGIIEQEANKIIDKSIVASMKFNYGPFDRRKTTGSTRNSKRNFMTNVQSTKGSKERSNTLVKKSDTMVKKDTALSKQGTIVTNADDNIASLNIQTEGSEGADLMKKLRHSKSKEQENAEKMAQSWKEEAENQVNDNTKEYLKDMNYRFISFIEKNKRDQMAKRYHDKVRLNECGGDFLQYLDHNSGLDIVSKEKLDENIVKDIGVMRTNAFRSPHERTKAGQPSTHSKNMLPSMRSGQSEDQAHMKVGKNILDAENLEKVKNCSNELKNYNLYAKSILINAKTGKLLKRRVASKSNIKANQQEGQKQEFQNNVHKQYQDNLFSQVSNQQISNILTQSRKYEISQMKEDFGIMKYIKKKYYQENYTGKDGKESGEGFPNIQLNQIKEKYFKGLLHDMKERTNEEIKGASNLVDKIEHVDLNTKQIYKDILSKTKGLNSKEERMQAYQYDQDFFIAPNMISKEAIQEEVTKVAGTPNRLYQYHKHGGLGDDSSKDTRDKARGAQNISPMKEQLSQVTSLVTSENFRESVDASNFEISKRKGDYDVSLQDQKTIHDEHDDGRPDSSISKSKHRTSTNRISKGNLSRRVGIQTQSGQNNLSSKKPGLVQKFQPSTQKSVQQVYLDSDYWYHKGVVLNQMGENEYALNCYNQALKIDPTHRPSRFNLACAYEKLKQYNDASAEFRHAIRVKESWPDAHYGLALCSLKLAKYHEAVQNIENAVKWSIVDYKEKLSKRQQRRIEKERRIREEIERGEISPINMPTGKGDQPKTETVGGKPQIQIPPEMLASDDEEDSQDELYIDPSTKKNGGVSTHIMYVRALCHREIKQYKIALDSYAKVMKRENELNDYEKMIEEENKNNRLVKNQDDPNFPTWKIDLFSHFKRLGLLKSNERIMMVEFRDQYSECYTLKEGWNHDKIPDIIKDLQRIRFFNRFDRETLYQMMKKTDFRTIQKHFLLFLEPHECAIIINGSLNLFSHKNDVATPILQAIYNPGDIIGNSTIDGGWSRDTHSWIIAYKSCDILIMNKEYVDYLWDKMKSCSKASFIADRLKTQPWFKGITEQSIYTIAFDLLYFKKFDKDEQICAQAQKSIWNIEYMFKEMKSIGKFKWDKLLDDPQFARAYQIFQRETDAQYQIFWKENIRADTVKFDDNIWSERQWDKDYKQEVLSQINIRQQKYGKKKKNSDEEDLERPPPIVEDEDINPETGSPRGKPDPYKLSLPDFPRKPTAKELEEEEALRAAREPHYARMVRNTEENQHIIGKQCLLYMQLRLSKLLESYQQNRKNFPKDSDGLYILLEGAITVKNNFNATDPEGAGKEPPHELYPKQEKPTGSLRASQVQKTSDRPEALDVFGAERFLFVQGFSYFGSIYATTSDKQSNKFANTQTTCGFIRGEDLSLLPFYDLYKLKEDLEDRYKSKCEKLKKNTSEHYNYVLRKIQQQTEQMLNTTGK